MVAAEVVVEMAAVGATLGPEGVGRDPPGVEIRDSRIFRFRTSPHVPQREARRLCRTTPSTLKPIQSPRQQCWAKYPKRTESLRRLKVMVH